MSWHFLSFLSNDVGFDLGTCNTLVYVKGMGIVLDEPSVVAVEAEQGKVIAIGSEAKEMLGRTPSSIRTVRPMKDGVIADFQMAEAMLREFIKRVIRKKFLIKPRIVMSVPSGITEVEKRAVIDSAEGAGAREVYLVKEPMAAAVGVGIPIDEPCGNMIIDIGGGTSEIAVIALSDIVDNTSIRIAGDEMNEAVLQYMKKEHNLLIGEQTAEKVKLEIGNAYPPESRLEMDVKGQDLLNGLPRTVRITSDQIREALSQTIDAIMGAIMEAFEKTPPELASDILDRGIILTGGGSLLRGLDRKIQEKTKLHVHLVDDPLTCVVRGAGKIINDLDRYSNLLLKENKF